MKIQKQGFQTWKNSKRPQKMSSKKILEWFRIKTIDPFLLLGPDWLFDGLIHLNLQLSSKLQEAARAAGVCPNPAFLTHW